MSEKKTTQINVLSEKFEGGNTINIDLDLAAEKINEAVVYQANKAILAGRRQGTAATKTKAMVRGGGAKPFRQKGTGRARQGSKRSPLLVGGGTVFGPMPRSYDQKVNKKMMKIALQSVLADKFQAGKLVVLEKISSTGKTKDLYKLLEERNLGQSLIVTKDAESLTLRAARNLRRAQGMPLAGLNVYEMLKFENLIMEKDAFEEFVKGLS